MCELFGEQLGISIRWCFPFVQFVTGMVDSMEADLHGVSMVVALESIGLVLFRGSLLSGLH